MYISTETQLVKVLIEIFTGVSIYIYYKYSENMNIVKE